MPFARYLVEVTVTYDETASGTRPAASKTGLKFRYWVTGSDDTTRFANADTCLYTQFANMRASGRTVTITGHALVITRPDAPLEP